MLRLFFRLARGFPIRILQFGETKPQKYICEQKKQPPKFGTVTISSSEFAKFSTKSVFNELTEMKKIKILFTKHTFDSVNSYQPSTHVFQIYVERGKMFHTIKFC
jgi:hypothetical protein